MDFLVLEALLGQKALGREAKAAIGRGVEKDMRHGPGAPEGPEFQPLVTGALTLGAQASTLKHESGGLDRPRQRLNRASPSCRSRYLKLWIRSRMVSE